MKYKEVSVSCVWYVRTGAFGVESIRLDFSVSEIPGVHG